MRMDEQFTARVTLQVTSTLKHWVISSKRVRAVKRWSRVRTAASRGLGRSPRRGEKLGFGAL